MRPEPHRPDSNRLETSIRAWSGAEGPTHWASVPGRTELAGNHTDHQGGRVLAASVDADLLAIARPLDQPVIEIESEGFDRPFRVELGALAESDLRPRAEEKGTTESLMRGVVAGFVERGWPVGGLRARVTSRVGAGEGLSSSAAFEVLVGALLDAIHGRGEADPLELARIAQAAENTYFGKPCGLMDQAACALGGVVTLDFADPSAPVVRRTSLDLERWGYRLLLVDTASDHAELTDAYAAVPEEMFAVARLLGRERLAEVEPGELLGAGPGIRRRLGDRAFLRALHFVRETRRVPRQVDALEADDRESYLRLVRASGRSSLQWLQNVAVAGEIERQPVAVTLALAEDWLTEHAQGADGDGEPKGAARVHGGGFAGRIQVYLPAEQVAAFRQRVEPLSGAGAVHEMALRSVGVAHGRLSGFRAESLC